MSLARLKQFKDIELSYDAVSGLALKLYTDLPGGTLALRKTLNFPATTGRGTKTLPLDDSGTPGSPVEGTLYQLEASSAGIVRLFGGIMRVRGIGVWFDGAAGEKWVTQPAAIGMQG